MTVKEIRKLIAILRKDINDGVDVEFNKKWISILESQMAKSIGEALKSEELKIKIKKTMEGTQ